ncbi:hypothetical protein IJF91_00315 [Candidatus Saccharibacteria bacterium]|nr:hypothetical protein [Candidatus Saccharibacteria bacterium]
MKKYFCLFMVTMLTMALTACGEKTTENTPSEKPVEYTGEGEVQGGIPTDEELAEREEEAKTYEEASEEPTVDYSDANVEMETTPTASDTYISADNFWQGEDYFDLEEYLYMNGADKIIYLDEKADVIDYPEEGKMVFCRTNIGHWRITIAGSGSSFLYFKDDPSNPASQPIHSYLPVVSASGDMESKGSHIVVIDQHDNFWFESPIIALDHLMWLIKQYPDEENPFQYADENIISMCVTNY